MDAAQGVRMAAALRANEENLADAASYDPVAEVFDHWSGRLTVPLARYLVSLARVAPGQRVLDIGTGTGVVAFEAARRAAPGGSVLGIDLSQGMLRVATRKAGSSPHVSFARMDAEYLELEDGSFDAVLAMYSLLHLEDPLRALREMLRVVRPGGRLVVGVGSGAPRLSRDGLARLLLGAIEGVGRMRGRVLVAPSALETLIDRRFSSTGGHRHIGAGAVPSLIQQAGFRDIRVSWRGHQARIERDEDFWDLQRAFSSRVRHRLAALSSAQVEALRREFLGMCARTRSRGGRLVFPYGALFVAAAR